MRPQPDAERGPRRAPAANTLVTGQLERSAVDHRSRALRQWAERLAAPSPDAALLAAAVLSWAVGS